ncbi:polysaccharide deacetylase family protein [Mucilaginibacter sp. PAMB04274]|uniref:polysaccharide deacetylase family protein n=1 Tax=Mucilaginibacter sp. PAMB04274 TaxID=3138568 RepID=UPI0031F65B33
MNPLKKLYFSTVNKLDIDYLKRKSDIKLLAPYYHLVSNEPVPYLQHLYQFKNTSQFEHDLDYMLKHFNPITLKEVIDHIKAGTAIKKNSFLITLDDGLKQVHEVIAPILLKKGVPAALFIVPTFLDNKFLFYDLKKGLIIDELLTKPPSPIVLSQLNSTCHLKQADVPGIVSYVKAINYLNKEKVDELGSILEIDFNNFLNKTRPFMTTAQVEDFISKGFDVGAHSMTHPCYNLVPIAQQITETQESVKWVADTFNLPYKAFAFPHVDTGVSQQFFDAVLTGESAMRPDVIFGNRTAMLEPSPHIFHRYIGENPAINAGAMAKAVLSYNTFNKLRQKPYIHRP